jgi:hypothetical protein
LAIGTGVVLADACVDLPNAMAAEAGALSPGFSPGDWGAAGSAGALSKRAA